MRYVLLIGLSLVIYQNIDNSCHNIVEEYCDMHGWVHLMSKDVIIPKHFIHILPYYNDI